MCDFVMHVVGGCTVNVVNCVVAAIGLGSNLRSAWGGRKEALLEAVRRVGMLGSVIAVSSFCDSEPVGYLDQPHFLNGALLLETTLEACELMDGLLRIEAAMGRVRLRMKGPRVIDLDLLLFGDAVIESERLVVPHPGLAERLFVLEPLAEIAPEMRNPLSKLTAQQMLAACQAALGRATQSG